MFCYARPTAMALALAAAFPVAQAQEAESLETIVVTTPPMRAPLEVSFDPKAPQQPIPANDGASLLKTIPGMNVIRKGGTDGDPTFRGMAASRLNILLDGEQILGGCGMRMDPPTAYIFPDSYDKVTLGVDNLFDKTYADAINRGSASILGYDQTTRVNEPGRTFWLKAQIALD